jgi:hypothetical protein
MNQTKLLTPDVFLPLYRKLSIIMLLVVTLGCNSSLFSQSEVTPLIKTTQVDWSLKTLAGAPHATIKGNTIHLSNNVVSVSWSVANAQFRLRDFTDLSARKTVHFDSIVPFSFKLEKLGSLDASQFTVLGTPKVVKVKGDPQGIRIADRIPGVAVQLTLHNTSTGMMIDWQAELLEGSNYVRQLFTIRYPKDASPLPITGISLVNLPVVHKSENALGTVPGSPYAIPGSDILVAIEQPGYWPVVSGKTSTALEMPMKLTLLGGDSYQLSTMMGVFPHEQLRRSFLYYIERERASPSRRYLHYNNWYDLAFNLSDKTLTKVSQAYGKELLQKRGIALDGFVLDDGWDDPNVQLWKANTTRFPHGWSVLKKEVQQDCHASLGIWISPCGGYGGQNERIASAKKLGALSATDKTLDLGIPGYYALFRDICRELIHEGGMNYFKWDNAAPYENNGKTFSNLQATSHFMRLCQLARELRHDNPKLFINATVGTWPSPFWLNHVDCTWRMGLADVYWIGKGDKREQSMNYRDGEVYEMVVKRAPLYPLNSMMFHGVVLGHEMQGKTTSQAGNHMTGEFRSYFAMGTNLQELYLSPDMMNDKAWDDLADAIRWNQKHAATLVDSHWVQGNPKKEEPYAVASWRRNSGTLMMRNPSDKPQTISIDIKSAFELPVSAAQNYSLTSPYADQRLQSLEYKSGQNLSITLQPFEVLVFDAVGK